MGPEERGGGTLRPFYVDRRRSISPFSMARFRSALRIAAATPIGGVERDSSFSPRCHQPTSHQSPRLYPTDGKVPGRRHPRASWSPMLAGFGNAMIPIAVQYISGREGRGVKCRGRDQRRAGDARAPIDGRLYGPLVGCARIESTGVGVAADRAVVCSNEPRCAGSGCGLHRIKGP